MYVKVIHNVRATESNDLYVVPDGRLTYGDRFIYDEGELGLEAIDRICWTDLLGIESNAYIHVAIEGPTGYTHHKPLPNIHEGEPPLNCKEDHWPFWVVRWAWWYIPESQWRIGSHSIEAVVTTGQMFIMGDNGDTIERVR